MAQFDRITAYNVILEDGLIPLFYNKDIDKTKKVTEVLVKGGAQVLEFTNRGDLAIDVFSDLIKFSMKEYPDLVVGAGSVIDTPTAALYIAMGANFIKNILGPMPWSKLMPTGGVTAEESNIKAWFDAGVACIGMGSKLISSKLIPEGNYNKIASLTSEVLKIIKSVRKT
jgi:2-dehydro-3-deoxyphosphogluconate aldolase/(4S)-4-hydroxy-2-oxoglutarate aldolase